MDDGNELKPDEPVMYKVGRGYAQGTIVERVSPLGTEAMYSIRSANGKLFHRCENLICKVVEVPQVREEPANVDQVPAAV